MRLDSVGSYMVEEGGFGLRMFVALDYRLDSAIQDIHPLGKLLFVQ